ncbi:Sporulation and spore germination [Micromonospora phaseoli]|uniref:Sporulation and spore germination n=1 Tax=Micromonospora phaseoli TaxID=1144548 RepID=A0A1H6ULH2_9ACTN|nr:Gmad2 immunoglobulin-like domain-containing protein [Micromonospora phaseoli]PZV98930.1 sporulation and spore germination protein [Micromonospora phaseoli]GIJ76319.1 hypothetical protein Xph01_07510 [Micromonospora phaseoli]SEI88945.1 Sporulation and spore germination [Micromonospora phaseoli]
MSRRRAATAVVLLLVAGCAPARSGSLGPAPVAPTPTTAGPTVLAPPVSTAPPPTTGSPAPAPPTTGAAGTSRPATLTLELWYVRDGRLVPTRRVRPATVATSRLALSELAVGPTSTETAAGLVTLLPDGVQVSRIDSGVATVRMSTTPEQATGRLREAQVVYTLTQFPTVRQVAFGADAPADRADYADLLPAIVVTDPTIGGRVSSPVTVTGTADVFEATVSVRVLDSAGRPIATAFTTATCGTGCRGGYRIAVAYRLARDQPGTIEVYEVSAADGSRTNLATVPVTLTAAG